MKSIFVKSVSIVMLLTWGGACDSSAGSPTMAFRGVSCGVTSQPLDAVATFQINGDQLRIGLVNTSRSDVLAPAELLVGVYFDLAGDPELTPVAAFLRDDSVVLFPPGTDVAGTPLTGGTYPGGDVGAEWAYNPKLCGIPSGATQGVCSWGMGGVFGNRHRFDKVGNLQGPKGPDGPQYGITTAADDPTTGNPEVTGGAGHEGEEAGGALIQHAVIFVLEGLPEGFTLADISNVGFQYQGITFVPGTVAPGPPALTEEDCFCAGDATDHGAG